MLTTIQGTYSNGVVVLNEQPPTTKPVKVLITFTEETIANAEQQQPKKAGFGKGTFLNVAADFDAPLEDLKDYM